MSDRGPQARHARKTKIEAAKLATTQHDAVRPQIEQLQDGKQDPLLDGRRRAVIDQVLPAVDGGRFAIKRSVGEKLEILADAFVDGHEVLRVVARHRRAGKSGWTEVEMASEGNDRWCAEVPLEGLGRVEYTVAAWPDHWLSWRHDFVRRIDSGDVDVALTTLATLIEEAAMRAAGEDAKRLRSLARDVSNGPLDLRREAALTVALDTLMRRYPARAHESTFAPVLSVIVDPPRARFSAWYELFPRSIRGDGTHGTLADVEAALPQIAELGFDVLYLPPIHPIGVTKRKGKNNVLVAGPKDTGSPWAIGAREGGHKSVHPELGNAADVARLAAAARALGIEVALDIAFQCSPDHPYVHEHPQWFRHRPDGSVQYAENPPKKYEDIYPFDFDTEDWPALWSELESVFRFWIGHGVHVFRVDNPHTKPFAMWEWMITRLKADHPELIFLSEAFTRPKVMHRLAKLGFTQSYTYFAWRNNKAELIEYFTELAHDSSREYFRPNVWPNTPDILTEALQHGGRATFVSRLVLAATLSANYGVYGPAYELMEHLPRSPGSEEYLHSEKYEIRRWLLDAPGNLRPLMSQLNRIRRENPALQSDWSLRFVDTDNDLLIAYSKVSDDGGNVILVVVNLDQRWPQSGWITLDLADYGLVSDTPFIAHDLLDASRYQWHGARNYVALDPAKMPAHVFRIETISPLPDQDA